MLVELVRIDPHAIKHLLPNGERAVYHLPGAHLLVTLQMVPFRLLELSA